MTNTEWLRKRIEDYANGAARRICPSLAELAESEWCAQFEKYMRNRLLMGYFRYGPMGKKPGYDNIGSAKKRLELYEQTGNLECLVDIANLMMVEFLESDHPLKHFCATDDGEHVQPK